MRGHRVQVNDKTTTTTTLINNCDALIIVIVIDQTCYMILHNNLDNVYIQLYKVKYFTQYL